MWSIRAAELPLLAEALVMETVQISEVIKGHPRCLCSSMSSSNVEKICAFTPC